MLKAATWMARGRTDIQMDLRSPAEAGRLPALIIAGRGDAPVAQPLEDVLVIFHHTLQIGRGDKIPDGSIDCDLLLPDTTVSARHACITKGKTGWVLEDLQSTNGTLVDGHEVRRQAVLRDGSLIHIGQYALVFRLITTAEAEAIEEDARAPLGGTPTLNPALAGIRARLRKLARSPAEILLLGETGAGKEVHARAIHAASGRGGAFTAINCAALPAELLESELFGYERGAHSTAQRAKRGLIEEADGGTLFLDEIGEMPLVLQAKLLRFLETRTFTPLGSAQPRTIDARFIAATNRGVDDEGEALRSDLVARLGGEAVTLPPLRERRDDLALLVARFMGDTPKPFSQAAWRGLCLYRWPRNVRELEKVIRNALVLAADGPIIDLPHLPPAVVSAQTPPAPRRGRPGVGPPPSRSELEEVLSSSDGNVAEAARALGRHTACVWRWLKDWGVDPAKFRPARSATRRTAQT